MTIRMLIPICMIVGFLTKKHEVSVVQTGFGKKTDTLSKFDLGVAKIDECSKSHCIDGLLIQAKKLNSVLVVYKSKSVWIAVQDKSKCDDLLRDFPTKKISIGSGKISINGKPISKKNIVILE